METTKINENTEEKTTKKRRELQLKPTLKCLFSFLGGFLMMNPFVLNQLSPFSLSLTASLDGIYSVCSGAGAIIGTLVFFSGTMSVKYIASTLLCILINSLCKRYLEPKVLNYSKYINGFLCTAVIGYAISFATTFETEDLVNILCESVLCSGCTYLFIKANNLLWNGKKLSDFITMDYFSVILSGGLLLMTLYKYRIDEFSPVTALFAFAILASGRLRSSRGGATAGICLGMLTGLTGEMNIMCVGYAMAGFLCGEMSRKNKFLLCAAYIVPISLFAVFDGTLKAYFAIAEGILACAAILLIPDKFFTRMSLLINSPAPVIIKSENSAEILKKLHTASDAFSQVYDCVNTVRKALIPLTRPQLNRHIRSCWHSVCRECEMYETCKENIKSPDDSTIELLADSLQCNEELTMVCFPKEFSESCYYCDEIISNINNKYLNFVAELTAAGRVNQMQSIMSDQFKSMSVILSDIADDFDEEINDNPESAELCINEAKEAGLNVINANSYFDKYNREFITLRVKQPREDFNITKLTENLSNSVGTELDIPSLSEEDDDCTLQFSQKKTFKVNVGAYSRSYNDCCVCGDYYHSFRDNNNRYITILSDGMGTGTRAAVDSAMAAELFAKLVKSDFSFESALHIVNSALLVKSEDESLATLDILCVDLYTGQADFLKAGAAVTFMRRKDHVNTLEQISLPIGILRDISFSKTTVNLEKGDVILMVSDGIINESNGWIQQELKTWNSDNPKDLAKFIVSNAHERRLGKQRDDMTAIAIYIK